jgi:hypothetical protein
MKSPLDSVPVEPPVEKDALTQPDHDFFTMDLADLLSWAQLLHIKTDGVCS